MLFSVINISYASLNMYFEKEHTKKKSRIHLKISKKIQKIKMCILQQVYKIFHCWMQFYGRMRRVPQ